MTQTLSRNVASGAIVLLLHAAILLALVAALYRPGPAPPERLIEIVLPPPRAVPPPPAFPEPPRTIWAPSIAVPKIDIAPETPPASSSLEGLGHALFGCDTDRPATLTPEQRAQCRPFGRFKEPEDTDSDLRLPPIDPNSPYAQEIARRNAPAVPMEHPCSNQESINANLGLPCYSFSSSPLFGSDRER